jgi:exodeoxyribonuclease VII large subunit
MIQGELPFFNFDGKPKGFSRQPDFFDPKKSDIAAQPSATSPQESDKKATANLLPDVYSVTQLTRMIRLALNEHLPAKIVLAGEISNCKLHGSGHLYLSLKDENTYISAVMWKNAAGRLKFRPADGMAVVATGRVDLYEPQGKYQFYIDKLEPSGTGALELAFRQLAEKLRKEGLFDDSHKKPLPKYPSTIAIVTSSTGAAIEDIAKTLNRRFPGVRKLLYPVAVQGPGAGAEIAGAIAELNRRRGEFGGIDLMIVGRGGGSIEDLWAFNEDIVARAIFACEIPVISAVGHEIDLTIADLVADCRAATPTAAAELAVPDRTEILQSIRQLQQRLYHSTQGRWESAQATWQNLSDRSLFARPLDILRISRQLLDERTAILSRHLSELFRRTGRIIESHAAALRVIEPHITLARSQKRLAELEHRLQSASGSYYKARKNQLAVTCSHLLGTRPLYRVRQQQSTVEHLTGRIDTARQSFWRQLHQQLTAYTGRLENLNPRGVLQRGYSITRLKDTMEIIGGKTKIEPGDLLITELAGKTNIESKVTLSVKREQKK